MRLALMIRGSWLIVIIALMVVLPTGARAAEQPPDVAALIKRCRNQDTHQAAIDEAKMSAAAVAAKPGERRAQTMGELSN
jgi:hypothetical protein